MTFGFSRDDIGSFMNEYIEKLTKRAKDLGDDVYTVCRDILEDPKFEVWSGSGNDYAHHYGKGGLVQHISEVVEIGFTVREFYKDTYDIDSKEFFLSAFFHDVGKMYDYMPIFTGSDTKVDYKEWKGVDHKRYIHHISRSGIMWSENAKKDEDIYEEYFEKVLHAILAHHTFKIGRASCRERV